MQLGRDRMSIRYTARMAVHSTPSTASSAQQQRPGSAAAQTPIDSLPFLSRLSRTVSNGSIATGSPVAAAGARGGAANLPPAASGGQAAVQQLQTPVFGTRRSMGASMAGLAASPGFGATAGSGGSLRTRNVVATAGRLGGMSSRRLSAPTGYSESGMSDATGPSFSMQAPSGLSSDDEEEEVTSAAAGAGTSRRRRSSLGGVRPLAPAELALAEATCQLERLMRQESQRKVAAFERQLADIDADEAAELAAVEAQRTQQAADVAAGEAAAANARQEQRSALLSGLRSQHQQKAAEGQRKVQQLEAALAQQREAAAAAAKAQAERQAAAQAAAQSEQQRQQQEAAAKAASDAAAAEAAAAAKAQHKQQVAVVSAAQASGLRIAPSAAQWEKQCAEALAAAQASVKPFVDDRAMRDKKRAIDKFVTLNVQQISATLEQIRLKAQALVAFIAAQHGAQRTYALLTLANKVVSQCEVQVTRLPSFAFPLAEVAVAVMAAQPDFVPILAARLHQLCPLTVPKYFIFKSGADEDGYLKQLGYKISVDEDTGQVSKESTDEFVGRMAGYVMLYGAAMQSDNPQNPHGLQHAWAMLARLLNALPPNRVTATAVDALLKVSGYRLHQAYRGQFSKLLQYIDHDFLSALGTSNDPDARAVHTRIQTYLRTSQFAKPPEGRDMPQFDSSSYDRA